MIPAVRDRGRARVGPVMLALTLLVTFGLTLLVAFAIGRTAAAASQPTPLVPRSGLVAGRSYGQWLVAAYRWRLALPGVTSNKTSCFTRSQHGPVWFLNGSEVNGTAVTRTCAIPPGRYLMLLVPGIDCSTIEAPPVHATTNAGLRRCVRAWWARHRGQETVTLDGKPLIPPGYLVATSVFSFKIPARNNWMYHVRGRTRGRAAAYGYASIMRPLTPGVHTIVQVEAPFAHTSESPLTITYRLRVG
jgi:hypothetical protein